jgi:hypothetical protein
MPAQAQTQREVGEVGQQHHQYPYVLHHDKEQHSGSVWLIPTSSHNSQKHMHTAATALDVTAMPRAVPWLPMSLHGKR